MNKRAARILILFLVFAASVGVFTHLMSHETTENATDLDAASLPVLYMKTADTTVNRMYGYRQEMNGVTTRENLTPLPTDRSLTLEIDAKGQKIKNVTENFPAGLWKHAASSGNGAFQRARLLRGAAGECSLYRCRTAYDREYEKRKKRGNYI